MVIVMTVSNMAILLVEILSQPVQNMETYG